MTMHNCRLLVWWQIKFWSIFIMFTKYLRILHLVTSVNIHSDSRFIPCLLVPGCRPSKYECNLHKSTIALCSHAAISYRCLAQRWAIIVTGQLFTKFKLRFTQVLNKLSKETRWNPACMLHAYYMALQQELTFWLIYPEIGAEW